MRFLNLLGNKFFAYAFSFLLGQRLKITAAFVMTFYDEASNETLHPLLKLTDNAPPETFDKRVFTFALGLEYRFLGPDAE